MREAGSVDDGSVEGGAVAVAEDAAQFERTLPYASGAQTAGGVSGVRLPMGAFAGLGLIAIWLPLDRVNNRPIYSEIAGAVAGVGQSSTQRMLALALIALCAPLVAAPILSVLILAAPPATRLLRRLPLLCWTVSALLATGPMVTGLGLIYAGATQFLLPIAIVPLTLALGAIVVVRLGRQGRSFDASLALMLLAYAGAGGALMLLTAHQFSMTGWPVLGIAVGCAIATVVLLGRQK